MTRRLYKVVFFLWTFALVVSPMMAQEPAPPPPVPMMPAPSEPEGVQQWLDEVRAQRRVREERRRAAKEARDARRRLLDPWGAAQQEAREKQQQLRRDAFMEEIDRKREAFRNRAPWGPRPAPWQEMPKDSSPGEPAEEIESTIGAPGVEGQAPTAPPYPPLPGWDNRWYYRGY